MAKLKISNLKARLVNAMIAAAFEKVLADEADFLCTECSVENTQLHLEVVRLQQEKITIEVFYGEEVARAWDNMIVQQGTLFQSFLFKLVRSKVFGDYINDHSMGL